MDAGVNTQLMFYVVLSISANTSLRKLCRKKDGFTSLLCKFRQIILTSCPVKFLKIREINNFLELSVFNLLIRNIPENTIE